MRQWYSDAYTNGFNMGYEKGKKEAQSEWKKGKWVKVGHWGRTYKCNRCGNYLDFDGVNAGRGDANFCPNCGADMRGE